VQISEYQHWLEAWDRARGWDRVSPSHTLIHAMEEMGELARLVLRLEGYKETETAGLLQAQLADELSDLFVFLFKLAYQCGVDVEQALVAGQAKADARHGDLVAAGAELDRYLAQQARNAEQLQRRGDQPSAVDDTLEP